jgi:hypothetical protein
MTTQEAVDLCFSYWFMPMSTAPIDNTSIRLLLNNGDVRIGHREYVPSGKGIPSFQGWFIHDSHHNYTEVRNPLGWQLL